MGSQSYFSAKSSAHTPASVSAGTVPREPQAQPDQMTQFMSHQQPYQSQTVGSQLPQSSPQQPLPYQSHGGGPGSQLPQSSPQQPLPYQSYVGGPQPHQVPQYSSQKQPLPYHSQDRGPQVPQPQPEQQSLPYQSQIGGSQPYQMRQSSSQQPLPYHGQDRGSQSQQVPPQFSPQLSLPRGPLPYQFPQSSPQKQPLPHHGQAQFTIQQQSQPYHGQVRPAPANQPFYPSQSPAQRPQNLVSHKLPMNPNFNRALLAESESQPQNAQNVDGADHSTQHPTPDHGAPPTEAQFGGTGAVPAWNQPTAADATPGWQEYGVEGGDGYGGRGMYVEENGGYHSLPRAGSRPVTAAEPPVAPPPPPPPNPCELNISVCLSYRHSIRMLAVWCSRQLTFNL